MLLRDPYVGHRDYFTGEPDGPLNEWTSWDFALAVATQAIIDGTSERGLLRWEVDDEAADIAVVHEIDREREAVELVERQEGYKPGPGEWLRTTIHHPYWKPESGEPQPFQTRSEWIKKMIEKEKAEGGTID